MLSTLSIQRIRYASFAWVLFSLIVLLLLFTSGSGSGISFGMYSARYMFAILVIFGFTIVASWVFIVSHTKPQKLFALRLPRTYWFGWLIIIASIAVLLLIWLAFPSNRNDSVLILARLYCVAVIGSLAWLTQYFSRTHNLTISIRFSRNLCWFLILLTLLLVCLFLGRVPHILFADEAPEINLSWSMFTTRSFYWGMYPEMPPKTIALIHSGLNPLTGYWMSLTGVGLEQARLFTLILGTLSLPFIYLTARRLYNGLAAWIAVAVGALILLPHNYARPDLFVVTMTAAAMYFFVTARDSKSLVRHYLVGLLVAFGMEAHPYAIRFVIAFGLIYLVEYIQLLRTSGRWEWNAAFWCFVLGGLSYGLFYLTTHVLVSGQSFSLADYSAIYAGQTQSPYMTAGSRLSRMLNENSKFFGWYFRLHLPEATLWLLMPVIALRRRKPADKLILAIFLPSMIIGVLLLAHLSFYYWVYNMPFIAILTGAWLARIGQHVEPAALQTRPTLTLSGVLGLTIVSGLLATHIVVTGMQRSATAQFIEIGRQINSLIPKEASVVGSPIYYLGMTDRPFVSLETYYYVPNPSEKKTPDALILTLGDGDMNDPMVMSASSYVQQSPLRKAYCFYTDGGNEVWLFLREESLPKDAPLYCR